MKTSLFSSTVGDIAANLAFINNYSATTNPGASNDTTQGYQVGSVWINVSSGAIFTCIVATAAAAVWDSGGVIAPSQATPTAKTVSATLTAAELLAGIITVTQGSGAPSAQQLPSGTAIQTALTANYPVNGYFDFSVINLGGASEVASITVNTDVTIVGNAAIPVPATGAQSSGRFRCRKTADHVFVVYRIA